MAVLSMGFNSNAADYIKITNRLMKKVREIDDSALGISRC